MNFLDNRTQYNLSRSVGESHFDYEICENSYKLRFVNFLISQNLCAYSICMIFLWSCDVNPTWNVLHVTVIYKHVQCSMIVTCMLAWVFRWHACSSNGNMHVTWVLTACYSNNNKHWMCMSVILRMWPCMKYIKSHNETWGPHNWVLTHFYNRVMH